MLKRWVEGISILLDFVGSKYGQSMEVSLKAEQLVVTKVDETVLRKFNTKKDETDYLTSLKYWE